MGIHENYREFQSRKGYEEFFQEVRASGQNWVTLNVPEAFGSKNYVASRTYVPNPDIDFKVNDFILNGHEFTGRWKIMPVANLSEYRDNTDRYSYRVALRRQQVADYRRFMTKEGIFMPLLVFDAENELWLSGRHRAEAGKSAFDAFFAVVLFDLTPEEALYITDMTNQWHQESWSEDERALVALGHVQQKTMTKKEALAHVGLDPTDENPLIGARLYRRWDQSPQDRKLLESGVGGQGRPFTLKQWGLRIRPFGSDAIKSYKLERWLFLKEPEAKQAWGLLRSRTGSTVRGKFAAEFSRDVWKLKGLSVEARWRDFLSLVRQVREVNATRASKTQNPSDDRVFLNFMLKFKSMSEEGLTHMKNGLTKGHQLEAKKFVQKLHHVFVDEGR